MRVYKFGGASNATPALMQATANLIAAHKEHKLIIVVSALGKTTNALEKIAEAYFAKDSDTALQLFEALKKVHLDYIHTLLPNHIKSAEIAIKDFFTEIEWLLHAEPVRNYDYYYDQIVCCGELFSTCILHKLLQQMGVQAAFADARDLLRTDDNFRDAVIDWDITAHQISKQILPLLQQNDVVITQGFIGSTSDNESTTLGREGSDFTAAIFANVLEADGVTIWKDVEGIMSGDPKSYKYAQMLDQLHYKEVIEMAFYGAQVIHPKTIKPLQNKNIPLYARSFINTSLPGTIISGKAAGKLPPVFIEQKNQVLVSFTTKDFSFAEGEPINELHKLLTALKIKPSITQNAAISLLCCFTDRQDKIDSLAAAAAASFDVQLERNLSLLTIRHYTQAMIDEFATGREIVLTQRTPETIQMLVRAGSRENDI